MNLMDHETEKYLFKLLKADTAKVRKGTVFNYRWNITDAIKVFFFYMLLMFVGMPLITRAIYAISGHATNTYTVGYRYLVLFISFFINVLICSYVFYIVRIKYGQSVAALGLTFADLSSNIKLGIKKYLITLPVIILAGFIINLISTYYGIMPEMQDVVQWVLGERSFFVLFSLVFFGVVVAPVVEEILFRGFLQSALKNSMGGQYATLVSSALFAAVHMDAFAFLQIFILGMLLGNLYERTQTLAASVVVHILHNSLTLVFLLYFKFFFDGKVPVF